MFFWTLVRLYIHEHVFHLDGPWSAMFFSRQAWIIFGFSRLIGTTLIAKVSFGKRLFCCKSCAFLAGSMICSLAVTQSWDLGLQGGQPRGVGIGLRSKVRYITVLSCGAQGWDERHVLRNVLIHFIKDAKVMYPVAPFAKGQNSWLRVKFFQLNQTKSSQRQIDQKWVPVMLRNPKFRSGPLYKIGSRSTQKVTVLGVCVGINQGLNIVFGFEYAVVSPQFQKIVLTIGSFERWCLNSRLVHSPQQSSPHFSWLGDVWFVPKDC